MAYARGAMLFLAMQAMPSLVSWLPHSSPLLPAPNSRFPGLRGTMTMRWASAQWIKFISFLIMSPSPCKFLSRKPWPLPPLQVHRHRSRRHPAATLLTQYNLTTRPQHGAQVLPTRRDATSTPRQPHHVMSRPRQGDHHHDHDRTVLGRGQWRQGSASAEDDDEAQRRGGDNHDNGDKRTLTKRPRRQRKCQRRPSGRTAVAGTW
ncbi:hypothetical protein EDB85DRAFT_1895371 [Lactarius pseudohatsudake]|nr:hypothetical protein EDB85DRAFT_1895371 [Lactarius pseudohatsudake]